MALKVFPASARAAARREVRALKGLEHPGIPPLVDRGEVPTPWLAVRWFEGRPLGERPLPGPPRETIPLTLGQLLGALARVHARGWVHGDLQPSNVLVDDTGRVALVDFGLAERPGQRAADGRVSGTPAYFAPERRVGAPLSPESEVHAAAALHAELLLGGGALEALQEGRPPLWPEGLGQELSSILDAMLDPRPEARPRAAEALRRLLPLLPLTYPELVGHLRSDADAGSADGDVPGAPPLVGRDRVLESLDRVVELSAQGQGSFVVIQGERGLGRSRLLDEIAQRARLAGVRTLTGRCRERDATGPGPVRDALAELAAALRDGTPAEIAELLTSDARALGFVCPEMLDLPYVRSLPDPTDLSPDLNKFRVFSAVTSLLRNWSRREPLVLALDDVHEADDATVELVYYLQRNVVHGATTFGEPEAGGALSIVLTRREDAPQAAELLDTTIEDARRAGSFVELTLSRLEPERIGELVAGMLDVPSPPQDLLDLIVAECAGSPQVAVELVRSLHADGLLQRREGAWSWRGGAAGATGLADLLRRRLQHLDEGARAFLEAGAVLGREFETDVAVAIAGVERARVPPLLRQLTGMRLLAPTGRRRSALAHDQLRVLLLDGVDEDRRRDLHATAARALEEAGAGRFVEIARHLLAAGRVPEALDRLPRAAVEARTAGNASDALELLHRYLELVDQSAPRERRLRHAAGLQARADMGEILLGEGRHREAADAFMGLLAACRSEGDEGAKARGLVGLGRTANLSGDYDEGREHLVKALELAERAGCPAEGVQARIFLIQNAYMQGRFGEAVAHHDPALSGARQLGDRALLAQALRQVGLSHHFRGRSEEALPLYRDALALLEEQGDRRNQAATLHNLGILHNARGEFHVAMDCYERSLAIFRELGLRHETAACLANVGNVHLQRGQASLAEARYLEAQAIYREIDDRRGAADNLANLADVDVRLGRLERAHHRHRQALEVHRDLRNRPGIASATGNLVSTLLHLGLLEDARPLLADALDMQRELDSPRGLAYDLASAARLARLEDRPDEALDDLAGALAASRRAGDRYHAAVVLADRAETLERLGRTAEARAAANEAFAEATALGAVEEEVRALVVLAATSDADAGGERLRQALDLVDRLEAPELTWSTWRRAALLRARWGDRDGARVALDRAWERLAAMVRQLGASTDTFLRRRDVVEFLGDALELEEASGAPRVDAILDRYHLLCEPGLRSRAKRLLAERLGAPPASESELRRLRAFRDVVRSADLLSLDGLLTAFVRSVLEQVDAERGLLFLRHGSELSCRVAVGRDGVRLAAPEREVPRHVLEWVLREGHGLITEDAATDERLEASTSVADLRVKSLLAAPLLVDGEAVGVVYVDRRASGTRFSGATRADFEATCADLGPLVAQARRAEERIREIRALRSRGDDPDAGLPGMLGTSSPMRALFATARLVARSGESVLVTGESGTGKEGLARALHALSSRSSRPFVPLDCGAIPESLVESVLFGHVRGAFTGADADRGGVFEEADGGTLFLDEVTNASLDVQARLLRVLQEREVRRVGGRGTVPIDVRVIAATNRDLEAEVEAGRFREDLYYRLNVIHLTLPPLRERRDDVPLLAEHFLQAVARRDGKKLEGFTPEALDALAAHDWPGNVRELANCVARMAAFCTEGRVGADRIPNRVADGSGGRVALDLKTPGAGTGPLVDRLASGRADFWEAVREPLRRRELTKAQARAVLEEGLKRTRGSYKKTARLFGLRDDEYTRFMDFLRFNDLKLDFRRFRARKKK